MMNFGEDLKDIKAGWTINADGEAVWGQIVPAPELTTQPGITAAELGLATEGAALAAKMLAQGSRYLAV